MANISLKGRAIGDNKPVFLIAEAGVNHNGEIKLAHQLIEAAASAEADAVKFQTFIAEEIVSQDAPLAGHHQDNVGKSISHFKLIKRLEIPLKQFSELKSHCEDKGLIFLSTPYDLFSAHYLIELGCQAIKIASSEMNNYPLLDVIRKSNIPVILSTGMNSWQEIVDSVTFIAEHHKNICILKCTSNYPASPRSINLRGIKKLINYFPNYVIGFSDHSMGYEISLAALGMGATVIEKHFTLDRHTWGPDHKASLTPDEFKQFSHAVRKTEFALGKEDWTVQSEEMSQKATMQKGVYSRRDIKCGEQITLEIVKFLRPSGKITPKEFFLDYMNRPANRLILSGKEIIPAYFDNIEG